MQKIVKENWSSQSWLISDFSKTPDLIPELAKFEIYDVMKALYLIFRSKKKLDKA